MSQASPPNRDRRLRLSFWAGSVAFVLFGIGAHFLLAKELVPQVLEGTLFGPDGYTRLIRVLHLQAGGGWFDTVIPQMNAPRGLDLHWTKPLDVILLSGGTLLSAFMEPREALVWAGVVLSPVIHLITCLTLAWALIPLLARERRSLAAWVLFAQPGVIAYALAGRADHHLLLGLSYVWALGFVVRAILEPKDRTAAVLAGVVSGFGLWVSVEFVLPLGTFLATLCLLWIMGRPGIARSAFNLVLGGSLLIGLALFVERPFAGLFVLETDRISVVHLLVSLALCGLWWFVGFPAHGTRILRSVQRRIAFLTVVCTAGVVVSIVALPGVFSNPMVHGESELVNQILGGIGELQPLWPTDLPGFAKVITYLGTAVLSVPFVVRMVSRKRTPDVRASWLPATLGLALFLPLALYQIRFGMWAGISIGVGLSGFLDRVGARLDAIRLPPVRMSLMAMVTITTLLGFVALGGALTGHWSVQNENPGAGPPQATCRPEDLLDALGRGSSEGEPKTLLAHQNLGPFIAFHSRHSVVAVSYHRGLDGIQDRWRILSGDGGESTRTLAATREVDLLILCPAQEKVSYYDLYPEVQESLYERIINGRSPDWLRPLDLPEATKAGFLVLEVLAG